MSKKIFYKEVNRRKKGAFKSENKGWGFVAGRGRASVIGGALPRVA